MSSPRPQHRSLHLSLFVQGQSVGERYVPVDTAITVGPDPTDTLSTLHLSTTTPLVHTEDGLVVVARELHHGTLLRSGTAQAQPLHELPASKRHLTPGDRLEAHLNADVHVCLQFADRPPEPALLSGQFRPRFLDEDSVPWLISLSFWSALVAVVLIVAWNNPPVAAVEMQVIPERIVEVLLTPPDTADTPDTPPSPPPQPTSLPPTINDILHPTNPSGSQWGRRGLQQRSAVLQYLSERGALDNVGDPMSNEELEALLWSLEMSHYDDQLFDALGGPRGSVLGEMGDATIDELQNIGGDTPRVALANASGGVHDRVDVPVVSLTELVAMDEEPIERYGPPSTVTRGVIRRYRHQIRHCFEIELKRDPNLNGRVTVQFDIIDGRVSHVQITEDTAGSDTLGTCIVRRLSRWTFPTEANEKISLPLSFQ